MMCGGLAGCVSAQEGDNDGAQGRAGNECEISSGCGERLDRQIGVWKPWEGWRGGGVQVVCQHLLFSLARVRAGLISRCRRRTVSAEFNLIPWVSATHLPCTLGVSIHAVPRCK